MLTPAEEQAFQASQLAMGGMGAATAPTAPAGVASNPLPTPTPGEIFPSVTTSMPIAAGSSSSSKHEIEGEEAKKARLAADASAQASVEATRAAALGTTDTTNVPPPTIQAVPTQAPNGQGFSGGIQQGATLAEQKQFNALAEAAAQKQYDDQRVAAAQKLEEQRQAKYAALQASVEQAKKDYETSKSAPLFEKNGWGWDFVRALAAGAGAYGAAITGSPNFALQILEKATDRALDAKKQQMAVAMEKMQSMGVQQEQIDKWYDHRLAQEVGRLQVDLDRVKSAGATLLQRFPTEQLAAQQMIADKQAKLDGEIATRAKDVGKVTKESGTNTPASVVQVVQPGADKGQQAQRETVNELVASKQQAKLLSEFEAIVKKNPKAWNLYRDTNKDLAESESLKASGGGKLIDFSRGVGLSPLSLDERLQGANADPKVIEDAKRINQIWPIIQTGEARILDPVGVLNESSQEQARKHLNMYTMKPDEAVKLSEQFRAQHEERSGLLEQSGGMKKAQAAVARGQQAQGAQGQASGPPKSAVDLATRFSSLPPADQQKAAQALQMKKSDPRFKDADAWLKKRGLR